MHKVLIFPQEKDERADHESSSRMASGDEGHTNVYPVAVSARHTGDLWTILLLPF